MLRTMTVVALLVLSVSAAAQSGPPPGGGGGGGERPGGPGGTDGARRPPPAKPLKREAFDKAVGAMFRQGDVNGDGILTLPEVRATVDARIDKAVEARFRQIDSDGNGSIALPEFRNWQRTFGSAALSDRQTPPVVETAVVAGIEPNRKDLEDRPELRQLLRPIDATTLVNANTDLDAGTTLAELLAFEGKRFAAADKDGDGAISPWELDRREPPTGRPAEPYAPPGNRELTD